MNRSNTFRSVTCFLGSVTLFLGLACIADHFVLRYFVNKSINNGILFPPGSEFPYQTQEFSHVAKINSLGFRDREWQLEKNETTTSIIAIGDSFTFGMGVDLEQTWSKSLEKKLRSLGFDVEIANLGRAGASPSSYLKTAQKSIPLLKPDIILIAILQGEDLAQTIREVETNDVVNSKALLSKFSLRFEQVLTTLYPHSFHLIQQHFTYQFTFKSRERLLKKIWMEQAEKLSSGYTGERRARFNRMGQTARSMFLGGNLNPGIVSMAISDPQYFVTPLRVDDSAVKHSLLRIRDYLLEIKEVAGDSEVLVVSVPLGTYTSKSVWQASNEIGFTVTSEMLNSSKPDDGIQTICDEIGIPFLSVTEAFRKTSSKKSLYYAYDGHLNAEGHETLAIQLLPLFKKHLNERSKVK